MLKRSRALYDTPCSSTPPQPPSKRAHTELTDSPLAGYNRSAYSTPFSHYSPRTPFSVPSDSPTNPFGLNRSLMALGLPPRTSFSKHITLRFQLVDSLAPPPTARTRRAEKGGVFRVAQVPTNFTFRHLHKLVLFLFASDIDRRHNPPPAVIAKTRCRNAPARSSASTKVSSKMVFPSSNRALSHRSPEKRDGHTFEAHKRIGIHSESTKPGVIKEGGILWAKLSAVRERRLFRDLFETFSSMSPLGGAGDFEEPEDEEDHQSWSWEAEDDFTIAHVWPKGPTLDRGIIYRHNSTVAVHITANTLPVPPRKGIGNKPYVFIAQGLAGNSMKIAHVTPNPKGGEGIPDSEDDEPGPTQKFSQIPITNWNTHDAFGEFLRLEGDRERALRGCVKPVSSDRVPSGNVSTLDDFPLCHSETEFEGESSLTSDDILFPFASSAITPYPTHPARRKRVERAERRLERLTRSGLSKMCSSDEEDPLQGAKEHTLDVSDDDGGRGECDDWDPFGDEAEI